MTPALQQQTLYEQDLALWCADTVQKLQTGDFAGLDIEHLIEEIEGLTKRDRNETDLKHCRHVTIHSPPGKPLKGSMSPY